MENKAQGAIEYLLIIGAAVIIAVIVITLMMSLSGTGSQQVKTADAENQFHLALDIKDCTLDCSIIRGPRTGKLCSELASKCKTQ